MIARGARPRAFPAATPAAARLSRLRKAAENLHRGMVGAPATRGHRRAATRVLGIRAHRRAVTLRREVAAVAAAIPHRAVPQGVAAIPRRAIPQAVVAAGAIAAAVGAAIARVAAAHTAGTNSIQQRAFFRPAPLTGRAGFFSSQGYDGCTHLFSLLTHSSQRVNFPQPIRSRLESALDTTPRVPLGFIHKGRRSQILSRLEKVAREFR